MKTRAVAGILLACAVHLLACVPLSHACSGELQVEDPQLSAAIEASLTGLTAVVRASGSEAADYARYNEAALRKTFEQDVVALATSGTCSTYRSGEHEFSVHALTYADQATADRVAGWVRARKANTLKIESLAYYTFIPARTTLLFFVGDRASHAENRPLFEDVQRRYEAK
jgi:hypothetical protein